MQSSQDLNATEANALIQSDGKDLISHRIRLMDQPDYQIAGIEESGDIEEVTYDILECFPILLCQYVFQHFDANELLEMSTVNREWNKLVGERSQAGKLRVSFDDYEGNVNLKAKNALMSSERKYQNIRFRISAYSPAYVQFVIEFLAKRAGSWKSVSIATCGPIAESTWPKILQIIEPSVEKLAITDWFHTYEPSSVPANWTFPCLKLMACNVVYHNLYKYFGRVTSLVEFRWNHALEIQEMALDIRTMLRNNINLKELLAISVGTLFEDLSKIKFKLLKLEFEVIERVPSPEHIFVSFLKTQAQTLESLKIQLKLDQELLEFILAMPRLTSLTIVNSISNEIRELPVNTTINSLEVEDGITDKERTAYQTLIRAMGNLKHLECEEINTEMFIFLAECVPALESIEVARFNVSRIPEGNIFPNLKHFEAYRFHKDLQEPTGDNNFEVLVREQMRKSRNAI